MISNSRRDMSKKFRRVLADLPSMAEIPPMFGMVPLKQFHKSVKILKFNLILSTENLTNMNSRTLESIFWHHSNAQVIVHVKDISNKQDIIARLSEAGYNIQVKQYDLYNLLSKAIDNSQLITREIVANFTDCLPVITKGKFWYSHITDLLRFVIIYLEGGIYLDTDVIVTRPFHPLNNVVAFEDDETGTINGAVMVFQEKNNFVEECLYEYLTNYKMIPWQANGPSLITRMHTRGQAKGSSHPHVQVEKKNIFYPMKWDDVLPVCFESSVKNATNVKETIEKESFAVHLNNKVTYNFTNTQGNVISKKGTLCRWLLNQFCIFCDELV